MPDPPVPKSYMVVERFKDARAIYHRLAERGRMMPAGLTYVSSWIDEKLDICFQLMETHDPRLFEEWMNNWRDLMDFEIHPVLTSRQAAEQASIPPVQTS
jgi:hypothetical protein